MAQLMLLIKLIKEIEMDENIMWYIPESTLQAYTYQALKQQEKETEKTINNYLGDTDGTNNFGDC